MLAKGTPIYLIAIPIVSFILVVLFWTLDLPLLLIPAGILFGLYFLLISFFRDPERNIAKGVVSPADGVVKEVRKEGRSYFISVFMNIHNVHVNRIPFDGRVVSIEHIPGGFVPAFKKDSDRNERVVTRIKTRHGIYEITQIAGAVARRIVIYLEEGDEVRKGDRMGLIRYGSRVDLRFKPPPGYSILVEPEDRVKAGESQFAYLDGGRKE
ncbi:MAG: phosphatidylserine decarboxylase [Thermoplasmatota archaeon]